MPKTPAAQLVYDDLRRFCEARRNDIASIITRSQFLLERATWRFSSLELSCLAYLAVSFHYFGNMDQYLKR